MKTNVMIHRLAIASLLVVAALSIVGSFHQVSGAPAEMRLAPLFGIALWSWLLWKIWKRPRQWGLGVGIFLFLIITFQSYLWWLGINNPELAKLDVDRSVTNFILFGELPIFIAGTFCILLRFCEGTKASAGATVQHAGIYSNLEVPSTMEPLEDEIITKWVMPFYMWGIRNPNEFIASYSPLRGEVSIELCRSLLISFNWRPRIVAAYFAAIEKFDELEEHIGRLFLRSDVCYSGQGYALALAIFNTSRSLDFVKKYLDHYLSRQDLWFDQPYAMAALHYMDALNGTSYFMDYIPLWKVFIGDKPNHNLDSALEQFAQDAANIILIRNNGSN